MEVINFLIQNLILVLILFSLFSAFICFLLEVKKVKGIIIKNVALTLSLVIFLLSLIFYFKFDNLNTNMQFKINYPWISAYNINLNFGVDGLSILLIILSTLLTFLVILDIKADYEKIGFYISLYFLLLFSVIGTFSAYDIVLFYIFWEFTLIPMYLIIGVYGGINRLKATLRFFLYTAFGSIFMFWGIFWLCSYYYNLNNSLCFDIGVLSNLNLNFKTQCLLFLAFTIAFIIKVPLIPFHTWLWYAHVEAPTGGSVMLAAILLKMGTYGFLRFSIPMFLDAAIYFAPYLMLLGAIGVIYGSLMSYAQTDFKKLIAYSSIAHLGAITSGIFSLNSIGIYGAILQMINHGISTGALFFLVGMLYLRRHTKEINEFGGIAKVMPIFTTFFIITLFSSIALPGLNGFIGELLIIIGVFSQSKLFGILVLTGTILSAIYMLYVYEKVFLSNITKKENYSLSDLTKIEKLTLMPLIALMFIIGIYPSFLGNKISNFSNNIEKLVINRKNILNNSSYIQKEKLLFSYLNNKNIKKGEN